MSPSLAALEFVILATSDAAMNENFIQNDNIAVSMSSTTVEKFFIKIEHHW